MVVTDTIKIMLVDDHSLVRDGIKSLLEDEEDFQVIAEVNSGQAAINKLAEVNPDIIIMDIRMAGMSGIEATKQLVQQGASQRILMLSMHDSEEYVLQSIEAGAKGYLLKDAGREEFLKAIRTVHEGGLYFSGDVSKFLVNQLLQNNGRSISIPSSPSSQVTIEPTISLTKRESQILKLAATGMSNQEIADHLGKSKRTIESHRFNLMKKMEAKNLIELTNKARGMGLI